MVGEEHKVVKEPCAGELLKGLPLHPDLAKLGWEDLKQAVSPVEWEWARSAIEHPVGPADLDAAALLVGDDYDPEDWSTVPKAADGTPSAASSTAA